MEHNDFMIGYKLLRDSLTTQAMIHYGNKSEEWVKNNVPGFVYDEPTYNFIISSATCINITDTMMIYDVFGQWQRVILRKNNQ